MFHLLVDYTRISQHVTFIQIMAITNCVGYTFVEHLWNIPEKCFHSHIRIMRTQKPVNSNNERIEPGSWVRKKGFRTLNGEQVCRPWDGYVVLWFYGAALRWYLSKPHFSNRQKETEHRSEKRNFSNIIIDAHAGREYVEMKIGWGPPRASISTTATIGRMCAPVNVCVCGEYIPIKPMSPIENNIFTSLEDIII